MSFFGLGGGISMSFSSGSGGDPVHDRNEGRAVPAVKIIVGVKGMQKPGRCLAI
jgi:hypothetical protein